ncbi:hypothetical protein [Rhodococcus sp. B10]|uniref:hypothetical protein n=1 Tax=Rhodococcus sp. B10 TaxID=2695876 RepID=UPI003211D531
MTTRTVTPESLGAWVIKCNPNTTDLGPMIAAGRAHENWCVASNYRTRLMSAGQRVLFWVSAHPRRGFWGAGVVTGSAVPGPRWKIATDIELFAEPVLASAIRNVQGLDGLEVFRSPQQSNPSWVDREQFALLEPLLPI